MYIYGIKACFVFCLEGAFIDISMGMGRDLKEVLVVLDLYLIVV